MQDPRTTESDFINKITEIIEENISNEQFGVSELAAAIGMSRSNLLRKIKKITKLSVSQFIRQVRLTNAKELLKQSSLTVSEISYEVGFSSTSYFIKCFHDHFGYTPGDYSNIGLIEGNSDQFVKPAKRRNIVIISLIFLVAVLLVVVYLIVQSDSVKKAQIEKSIAVLPFKNDSNDSSNVHIINGLMESILDNLQKIEELRVISRTSVEKYRDNPKTIPELASELKVNYFIEGSGQKIGDKILLSIQLIEAKNEKHLWSEQYTRETKDIFELQTEVAKNIAEKIQVIITPEEEERIEKAPTNNLIAYNYFLKGLELFHKGTREGLEEAIVYFKKAIEHDNEFARAYANLAISYYFLDIFQTEKKYADQLKNYADKALLFDSQLPHSLIAKALFYIQNKEFNSAVFYLEKALEYNPNSALVINTLSDFYIHHIPNTEKYLEYALRGIRIEVGTTDSVSASNNFLRLSNAFIQCGFTNEAEYYINKSLDYNSENAYSGYVKAYILYAQDRNLIKLKERLLSSLKKDTTRLDVLQEVGKIYFYLRDYEHSYMYYKKFLDIKEALKLDIYRGEDIKISYVLSEVGQVEKSDKIINDYKEYADSDNSVYKHLSLCVYFAQKDEIEKAIEHLEIFSQQENYNYWITLFLDIDPLLDKIIDIPEVKKKLQDIETKFWNNHQRIKTSLEEKKLL